MSDFRLINGDAIENLRNIEDNSVDMIMFDAPFYQKQYTTQKTDKIENYRAWMEDICSEFYRVLKEGGNICYLNAPKYVYCTCDIFLKRFGFRSDVPLIRRGSLRPAWMLGFQHNLLVMFYKGDKKIKWNGARKNHDKNFPTDVWDDIPYQNGYRGKGGAWHPEAIGVDLTTRCVLLNSDEGDTVLDCCMGSGTTGVVCVRNKRNFIGIELQEKYFKICKNRIEEEKSKMSLFD